MDDFVDAMEQIINEANTASGIVTQTPLTQPVRRIDDVKAAKRCIRFVVI